MRSLNNRFKEFRRPKKPRKRLHVQGAVTKPRPISKPKLPGIVNTVKAPTPFLGEDTVSYERHIRALQMEFVKTKRNTQVISKYLLI